LEVWHFASQGLGYPDISNIQNPGVNQGRWGARLQGGVRRDVCSQEAHLDQASDCIRLARAAAIAVAVRGLLVVCMVGVGVLA